MNPAGWWALLVRLLPFFVHSDIMKRSWVCSSESSACARKENMLQTKQSEKDRERRGMSMNKGSLLHEQCNDRVWCRVDKDKDGQGKKDKKKKKASAKCKQHYK